MDRSPRRTLIITLPPQLLGGVASKARLFAQHLTDLGHDVTFSYYAAHRIDPGINATFVRAFAGGKPIVKSSQGSNGMREESIGCWMPELEFTYTSESSRWRQLISAHDRVVAIGGSPIIANPAARLGVPHILWYADDLKGDREARRRAMSWPRRVVDSIVIEPALHRQQRCVFNQTTMMLGVSNYSVARLRAHDGVRHDAVDRLSIPVDSDFFQPPRKIGLTGKIGFAGRIGDARKKPTLLLETLISLKRHIPNATLCIAGPRDPNVETMIKERGLENDVKLFGVLEREDLRKFYQDLDAFVISSEREGLAIVGLEALASGVPVVSTRCGGPEDYVKDGVTGYLTDFDPEEIAARLTEIMASAARRLQFAEACRNAAEQEFSMQVFSETLDRVWSQVWDEPVGPL
jgi:glycosyltransferase involved in cell wall biosynthesis